MHAFTCRRARARVETTGEALTVTVATTIDCEVQVEPRRRGIGTRIDLTVTTPAAIHPATAPRVIAEAKLVTNDTLMTAMQDQLIGRYLIPEALQYGIYRSTGSPPGSARGEREPIPTQPNCYAS